ncbi:unnamed protein product [Chrysoparadoxa australica]
MSHEVLWEEEEGEKPPKPRSPSPRSPPHKRGLGSPRMPFSALSLASPLSDDEERNLAERQLTFRSKLKAAQRREMVYELTPDGHSELKEMTVRELYKDLMGYCSSYMLSQSGSGLKSPELVAPDSIHLGRPPTSAKLTKATNESRMSSLYLHHRDLRQLFSTNKASSEPAISVRRDFVLMNFDNLRAVIMADRLVVLVEPGADSILLELEREVRDAGKAEDTVKPGAGEAPFELKAMESVLAVSYKRLSRRVLKLEPKVKEIVDLMEGPGSRAATSAEANNRFRGIAQEVTQLENRAKARRRALLIALDDDEDLALMNLTKMKNHPEAYMLPLSAEVEDDHEEVELLLESYLQEINSMSNLLEILKERMRSTESLIMVSEYCQEQASHCWHSLQSGGHVLWFRSYDWWTLWHGTCYPLTYHLTNLLLLNSLSMGKPLSNFKCMLYFLCYESV